MKPLLILTVILLTAGAALAQPFPLPESQLAGSTVTYDSQGRTYETFSTPTGWRETQELG